MLRCVTKPCACEPRSKRDEWAMRARVGCLSKAAPAAEDGFAHIFNSLLDTFQLSLSKAPTAPRNLWTVFFDIESRGWMMLHCFYDCAHKSYTQIVQTDCTDKSYTQIVHTDRAHKLYTQIVHTESLD